MSIPLDRYYHYIENLCGDDTIIYHWFPHGSKKLENIIPLTDQYSTELSTMNLSLSVFCHDQEPLNFENYPLDDVLKLQNYIFSTHRMGSLQCFRDLTETMPALRNATLNPFTVYDKLLLCHSEKNSQELLKFEEAGFIGVYVWFHAIVSRDWFRYAKHDPKLRGRTEYNYDFLIYNRAWTGTREYRLKFCELLYKANLVKNCKTSFAPTDGETHYTQHQFHNPSMALTNYNLEDYFAKNTTTSCFSADYDNNDYKECGIEVVLETLFDDQRNHLTEKSLRPIACNKPFILAATPFSLEYLRGYGFKTFNGLIDETYDTIVDPSKRLAAIVAELKRISCLSKADKQDLLEKLNIIAAYNQKLFFSDKWYRQVLSEFKTNLAQGKKLARQHRTGQYLRELYQRLRDEHPDIHHRLLQTQTRKTLDAWLSKRGHKY